MVVVVVMMVNIMLQIYTGKMVMPMVQNTLVSLMKTEFGSQKNILEVMEQMVFLLMVEMHQI